MPHRSCQSSAGKRTHWRGLALNYDATTTQPGLIDIRVTATDQDGFSATQVQTVRVKDPLDASAPAIAWAGSLAGYTAAQAPVSISNLTSVQASLQELQLMGYQLQIAPAGTNSWATLAQQAMLATVVSNTALTVGNIDSTQFANGVYQLRLTAWDLAGRTSEINTRILIDSAIKQPSQATATDGVYSLGGHSFALLRVLDNPVGDQSSSLGHDYGNWRIPALQTHLTNDQTSATASVDQTNATASVDQGSATAPWQDGAKVWLTAPDLSTAINPIAGQAILTGATSQYVPQALRFTLSTVPERTLTGGAAPVGVASAAPLIYRPVFTSSVAGWTLQAHTDANQGPQGFAPEALQRQGSRLYTQSGVSAGLPWVPDSYTLTGPDGTRYQLDAQGHLTSVQFADGVQWLVSDAGIALVDQANAQNGGLPSYQRVDFVRDAQGRLTRVSTKSVDSAAQNATLVESTIAYKYDKGPSGSDDAAGRLVLSRTINSTGTGTAYGYDNAGKVLPDAITANLGAATSWISAPAASTWTGSLQAGTGPTAFTSIAFSVRESEITSTVKTPGGQSSNAAVAGAVIIALQTELADPLATVEVTGATVLGTTTVNGKRTTLLRVTEAGLKLIRIKGTGTASLSISIAGDINQDGKVNGLDSQAWAQGAAANAPGIDINGDGQATAADRQVLYANYGFKANQAPVQINIAALNTHTDLAANASLANVAQDLEGDSIFWRVLSATHGTAKLAADGQTLLFTPEMGYAGQATVTVQADDGFAVAAPIALTVNVSGARLIAIHVGRLAMLATAGFKQLQITGDFEDQEGVKLEGSYAQYSVINSSNANVVSISETGRVKGLLNGTAIALVRARGIEGVNVFTVSSDPGVYNYGPNLDENGFEVDVYPRAITLALQAQRQLKVSLPDRTNISAAAAGTQYFISDSSIADITPDGLIHAKANGHATLSIINGGMQHDIVLYVQQPDIGTATIKWASGAAVQDTDGNLLMIAPGSLPTGTQASIRSHDMADLGMPLPAPGILTALAAIDIDVGSAGSKLPLQLAIKVTPPIDPLTGLPETLAPGSQVQFWRKGSIVDTDGSTHDTWWLVDNGVIGDDGMARTSSLPFTGVKGSSLMLLTKSFAVNNAIAQISAATNNANAMWSSGDSIAMAMGYYISSVAIDIFGGIGSLVSALMYTPEGSFKTVVPKQAFDKTKLAITFPAPPDISVNEPTITRLEFDPVTRKLTVSGINFLPPNQAAKNFDIKLWLEPRGEQIAAPTDTGTPPDRGMIWQGFTPADVKNDSLEITLPEGVALSMHDVYIERIAKSSTDAGQQLSGVPVQSDPIEAWVLGTTNTIVTTAHEINVFKTNPAGLLSGPAPLSLLAQPTKDEKGNPLNLFGRFGEQIAYSDDGTQAYIAGADNGTVYVFDTQTQRIVHTIKLVNSTVRVSSLAVSGGWLYASEGNQWGGVGGRLVRVNVNQMDAEFLREQQVVQFGAVAPFGFADMAINNGSYLALTAPVQYININQKTANAQGNVYILDIGKIDKDGRVPESAVVTVDASKLPAGRGSSPQYISAGPGDAEFLLSSARDHSAGLTSIKVTLTDEGNLTNTVTTTNERLTPEKSDRSWLQRKFQQNIQRAAGNVIVEYEGKQYALVADYNFLFNDANFVDYENYGFGKEIGGKIGIVQDPFGKNGNPVYLGATSPIQGGAVDHLTLSADGTLYADVFMDEVSDQGSLMFKSLFVWDAAELIKDALAAQARGQLLSKPIDRVTGQLGQIGAAQATRYDGANATQEFGWTYGIGAYSVPGQYAKIDISPPSLFDIVSGGFTPSVDDNIFTKYVGITDDSDTTGSAAWFTAKYLAYTGVNFLVGGALDRTAHLTEEYIDGKLDGIEYGLATTSTVAMSVLSLVCVARVGSGVAAYTAPKIAGVFGGAVGQISGATLGGIASGVYFGLTQQSGKVLSYVATGGKSYGSSSPLPDNIYSEIPNDVMAFGGFGFLGGVIGRSVWLNAKVVWNTPTLGNPLPVRLAQQTMASDPLGLRFTLADSSSGNILRAAGGSIRRNGVVVDIPPRASMAVKDADAWLAATEAKIEKFIDPKASLMEKAYQWGQLSDAMVIASRNAMVDANAAARLNLISPPQTFAQFKAKWEKTGGGDKLWEKIIAYSKQQMREPGCFVAGTLVHTKEGLRPIEQIKVGDLVLSKPESGEGEQSYQPVTRTFSYENRELYLVGMNELDRVTHRALKYETEYFAVSGSHPIWVEFFRTAMFNDEPIITPVNAWVTVEDYYLKPWHLLPNGEIEENLAPDAYATAYATLSNGSLVVISRPKRIVKSHEIDEGVSFSGNNDTWQENCTGIRIRFGARGAELMDGPGSFTRLYDAADANYDYTGYDIDSPLSVVQLSGGHLPLRRTVYNIEVANTHTYFVGELGLWVHNKNPSSVPLLPAVAQNATQNIGIYVGDKALARFHAELRKVPGNQGIGITPDGTVGSKATDGYRAQALFLGSISQSGVSGGPVVGDKLFAYTIGGIDPIERGLISTAMGDALAWVVKDGKRVAPSNVLVDVKAGGLGVRQVTQAVKDYVDASRTGYVQQEVIDEVALNFAKTLLQRSAFIEQSPEFLGAYALDSAGLELYKDFVSFAVKDTRLAARLKAFNSLGFDPGLPKNINFTFDNWYSEKMLVGEKVQMMVDGELRESFGQYVWQLQKSYGVRTDGTYGMTDSKWIRRNTDDVVKPATGNAQNILKPLVQDLIKNGYYPQEVASEGGGTNVALLAQDDITAILPAARQYWLDRGALASVLNTVNFSIGPLPTAIAGQTQGRSIKLSQDGAGWGWFVDATPVADEEFSPDAIVQNLRASAGSAATGKLDLLTVLIHELGHVLGAHDLARAEDVMSGHLEAGVRRLPTAQDAALWLAAQSQRANGASGTSGTTEAAGFGVRFAPLMVASPPVVSAVPTPDRAINPTLANGNFAAGLVQWATTGNVAVGSSTITLGESTHAQAPNAHLAQAFVLTAQDRFLTFTVSGLNLQTNSIEQNGVFTAALQDAFEVALQNANTGANLLNTGNANLGTSHSDALLNLQLASSSAAATLQERAVSGLRHTDNADGSRIYVLDLSGIAAGTAVNLSFDLIGFGLTASQLGSKVNISDVRLISTPVAVNDAVTVAEDGSTTITVQVNDLNAEAAGFAPKLIVSAQHGQVSVNAANGVFSGFVYTPDANFFGADSFTYQYSNAAGTELSNTATVTLTVTPVNDAPVAADVTVSTAEDTVFAINLVATDADNTSAELVFSIQTQPAHGSLVQNADGSYSYTPVANYFGVDSFTYTVTDGKLVSNLATARINVTAVNDAPTLGNQALTVAEDAAASGNLLASASDIEGNPLTARVIAGPRHGTLTVNADGAFSYAAAADYFGTDSFTYRVNDGAGDGELDSEVATVSFTVTAVNDAPVASDVAVTTAEDNAVAINLIATDVDNTSASLQFTILTQPTHGTLTKNADSSYSYTPAADYNGADSFTYTVSDGSLTSNLATVRISITAVNDAPVLPSRSLSLNEDSPLVINPLAGATDVDGDVLTAAIVAGPLHGSLSVNPDGTYSYSPAANYYGTDSFTYRVSDGAASSELATVTLRIAVVNDAPVASDIAITTLEDTLSAINLIATDVDNTSASLPFTIQTQPTHGTLVKNADGSYSYTPAANYNGADSFTYTVSDGELTSKTATVRITVTAVNDAPTLGNQALTVAEDTVLAGNLLATAADIESSPLTARIIAGPTHGTLTVNANGTFSYIGNKDYFGADSMSYFLKRQPQVMKTRHAAA